MIDFTKLKQKKDKKMENKEQPVKKKSKRGEIAGLGMK